MGLTIHYDIRGPKISTRAEARGLIGRLHAFARTLPIGNCSKLIEWDDACEPSLGDLHSYLVSVEGESKEYIFVRPLELIMFALNQPGSETAAFGLARYPREASDSEQGIFNHPTGLAGWNWRTFCKTQYASLSAEGGWGNFFAIHDGICKILDQAVALGAEVEVVDDGGYWKGRDGGALRAEVERWNSLIAAFTGKFKDMIGERAEGAVVAPITQDPSYEALEAKGQELFKRRKDPNS